MKKHSIIKIIQWLILLPLIAAGSGSGLAQFADPWAPILTVPGYQDETLPPYLVVDQNKNVHAFTSQRVGEGRTAVIYSQWSQAGGWTMPVDILLSQVGRAEIYGAFLDRQGVVHVVFRGGDPRSASLYYSKAPLINADFAPAWSPPSIIGGSALEPGSAALVGDGRGNLVAIYAGYIAGSGVYAVQSTDAGESWSDPFPIYLLGDPNKLPYYLHMFAGQDDQVHAVWSSLDAQGNALEAYYARLDLKLQRWGDPLPLAEDSFGDLGAGIFGPAYPHIVGSENTLVVLYNANGGSATAGRPALWMRRSENNGESWLEAVRVFSPRVGLSGAHSMAVDGDGDIHALFIQRIERTINDRYAPIGGLWHSELLGGQWTEPDWLNLGEISGYDVRAVVSQGNTLLATWREDPGAGQLGVFYSYARLDTPELPVLPLPTVAAGSLVELEPTAASSGSSPDPQPPAAAAKQAVNTASWVNDAPLALIIGIVPVLLLLGIILAARLKPRRRRD